MRYHRFLILMVLQSCVPIAFPQATDSPIEYPWTPRCENNVGPGDPRWPGCIITHWYPDYQPGTISVISGSGSLSSASLGSVCQLSIINENISGPEVTLQLIGGFLDIRLMFKCIFDPGRAIGFPFPPFGEFAHEFSLSVTNTSPHPWTAFEIELQSALGQPSGADALDFYKFCSKSSHFDQLGSCDEVDGLMGPPSSSKFAKLQHKGDNRAVLLFSDGIVNPNETVTFHFVIRSTRDSFFIVQRPLLVVKTDLKPRDNPNCVNPASYGTVPVAILGDQSIPVTSINPSSLRFGGAAPLSCEVDEVRTDVSKKDRTSDLVCRFSTQAVAWPKQGSNCGVVALTGSLTDGTPIRGIDHACLAPESNCSSGTPVAADILPVYYLKFVEQSLCFFISGPGTTAGPVPVTVSSSVPIASVSPTGFGVNWLAATAGINTLNISVVNTSQLAPTTTPVPVNILINGDPYTFYAVLPYNGAIHVQANGDPATDAVFNVKLLVGDGPPGTWTLIPPGTAGCGPRF